MLNLPVARLQEYKNRYVVSTAPAPVVRLFILQHRHWESNERLPAPVEVLFSLRVLANSLACQSF